MSNSSPLDRISTTMVPNHWRRGSCQFLKGPVPLPWLQRAAKLPGRTLDLSIALWYRIGVEKTLTVTLTSALLKEFGVDASAKARALVQLEQAGLVRVQRKARRNPIVTVLQ